MSRNADNFSPRAAILDMDGLMLDTETGTFEAWPRAARAFGFELSRESVMRIIGINRDSARALFTGEYGGSFPYDEICDEARRLTNAKAEKEGIALKAGLVTLLDHFERRHIPFVVATSTARANAEWCLAKAGIGRRIGVMVCGDEIKNGKPAPDIFLAAAAKLDIPPNECAGFEDSGPGLLGLHAAGIASVFIRDLATPAPEALATVWKQFNDLAEAAVIFG